MGDETMFNPGSVLRPEPGRIWAAGEPPMPTDTDVLAATRRLIRAVAVIDAAELVDTIAQLLDPTLHEHAPTIAERQACADVLRIVADRLRT